MRVKIYTEEIRAGFPFKKTYYEVCLIVDFTHEEKQIISQRGLMDDVLMERRPADARPDDDERWFALQIRHLIERKPDRHRCATPSDAKIYQANVTGVMQSFKLWLDDNAELGGAEVFEL